MRKLWAALLLFAASWPVQAAAGADYIRLNQAVIAGHVLPGYARLAAAAAGLPGPVAAYCRAPSDAGFAALARAYDAMADAWQGVQHLHFGPIDLFMRGPRTAFWPDPRNAGGRQLAEVLSKRDPAAISPEAFARGSVAVQGLPALERLLFEDGARARLEVGGADAAFRCRMLQAIARNLEGMAADLAREWQDHRRYFGPAPPADSPYREPKEASVELFKSLYAAVEVVADHKLARPLGESAETARPRLAESWRSARSLANARIDLAAARAMYGAGFDDFVATREPALAGEIARAFDAAGAALDAVPPPLETAVTTARGREAVQAAIQALGRLKTLLAQKLTAVLDIPLGFNALDGD